MTEKSSISETLRQVRERIARAAEASGRSADAITLLAAVKTVEPERINQAIRAGITCIGDNRVQELIGKETLITEPVHKHFIGHLQTNKVKDVVGRVEMIHSVDSLHLAQQISRVSLAKQVVTDVLLEVNVGREESKFGFLPEETEKAVATIKLLPGIRLRGFMAIPPATDDTAGQEAHFSQMHKLFIDIRDQNRDNKIDTLSMGMSDSYETAIRCGATMVRLGTVLFGRRN